MVLAGISVQTLSRAKPQAAPAAQATDNNTNISCSFRNCTNAQQPKLLFFCSSYELTRSETTMELCECSVTFSNIPIGLRKRWHISRQCIGAGLARPERAVD
jgi:hypothetical protein